METKLTLTNGYRPYKEDIRQLWPSAYDEFDANPEANSHPIWVVACLLYSAYETEKIVEKINELSYLCQNYRIPCEGNPFDRDEEFIINPMFPEVKGKNRISGLFAQLSKETVRKHLQDYRDWPLAEDVPLSKWWEKRSDKGTDINLTTIEPVHGYIGNKNTLASDLDASSSESDQDSIIKFTKTVLLKHPGATTADLRRNCFEEMGDLNSRHRYIINNLLVKAGAVQSKKGEHAIEIDWVDKCPKKQWERVFKRSKR